MRSRSNGLCTPPPHASTRRVVGWCARSASSDVVAVSFEQRRLHVFGALVAGQA
jgi:hypothetical protein